MHTNLMQCAAYGLNTDRLTPHLFILCRNAGCTHTSISQTQPLYMTLSTCTQLLWWTMARPVLSGICPVKPLYGLGHCMVWCCSSVSVSWQFSYSLRLLYVEQRFFFSDPQRVICHEVPCWTSSDQYERVRAITPNLTHLLPIHTWDLVTVTSHMTHRERKWLIDSTRGVLTFVASGLYINGCVLSYFEGTANLHCYTSCTLTT